MSNTHTSCDECLSLCKQMHVHIHGIIYALKGVRQIICGQECCICESGFSCKSWSREGTITYGYLHCTTMICMYVYSHGVKDPNLQFTACMIVGAIFPQAKMALIV